MKHALDLYPISVVSHNAPQDMINHNVQSRESLSKLVQKLQDIVLKVQNMFDFRLNFLL